VAPFLLLCIQMVEQEVIHELEIVEAPIMTEERKQEELRIRTALRCLVVECVHQGVSHAQLHTCMQHLVSSKHQDGWVPLYLYETWQFLIECETEIGTSILEIWRHLDHVDSIWYESQLLAGISCGIQHAWAKRMGRTTDHVYDLDMYLAKVSSMCKDTKVCLPYLENFVAQVQQYKPTMRQTSFFQTRRRGGEYGTDADMATKKKRGRSRRHERLLHSNNKLIHAPSRAKGKSIVNRWKRGNTLGNDWTIGFTRQKLFRNVIMKNSSAHGGRAAAGVDNACV